MKRFCLLLLMLVWGICASAIEKSPTIVYINGSKYYLHTVQPGQTLYALSKAYEVTETAILESNPALVDGLKAAETIKIPCTTESVTDSSDKKLRKTFNIHYVLKGETLYALSRQYQIPIQTIIADNNQMNPVQLKLGERILIRKKMVGSEDEAGSRAQWEAYRQSLDGTVKEQGMAYHITAPGETFYSLSRRFGITEEQLSALNGGLKAADLKAGAMIKIPAANAETITAANLPDESGTTQKPAEQESDDSDLSQEPAAPQIDFRALRSGEPVRIALLLPFSEKGTANPNYLEFYQGLLLGLDSVKTNYGRSITITAYDTERNAEKVRKIVEDDDAFRHANLIIGPVYEEELSPVIQYAEQKQIPVVSPLANITKTNSDVLFQLAPDPAHKWDKVADLINGDRKVTLIYTASTDKEFEKEMLTLLGDSEYAKRTYKYTHPTSSQANNSAADMTPLLEGDSPKVFIIMSDKEVDVDRILAAIASANSSLSSRGHTVADFVVLGNTRWNRYNNIDRTVFFKDRIVFLPTYHAKRDAQVIADFDSAYIRSFGSLPSLYSYRGYDAALIFCPAMYDDIEYALVGGVFTPLQTSYRFGSNAERLNHVNRNWMRVNYHSDFTITIE